MPRSYHSPLLGGIAPLKVEIDRYINVMTVWHNCNIMNKDEEHVFLIVYHMMTKEACCLRVECY